MKLPPLRSLDRTCGSWQQCPGRSNSRGRSPIPMQDRRYHCPAATEGRETRDQLRTLELAPCLIERNSIRSQDHTDDHNQGHEDVPAYSPPAGSQQNKLPQKELFLRIQHVLGFAGDHHVIAVLQAIVVRGLRRQRSNGARHVLVALSYRQRAAGEA